MKYLAYTYLIKCPNDKSYYGYRSANETSPEDDLWKHYFTSSKVIAELREQYSDDEFIATVDKTFETAQEAHEYETAFLTENDCVNSDDWVNESCFPMFQDNTGKKHTEEAKRKIGEARKGKPLSDEHKKKLSRIFKGRKHTDEAKEKMRAKKLSEEHKKKLSEVNKGKKHTEETKRKISEARKLIEARKKNQK